MDPRPGTEIDMDAPAVLGHDPIGVIAIGEDITDWKNIQRQIAQTEKLAAVGQLAAGVRYLVILEPHGDLRDAVVPGLSAGAGLHLYLFHAAGGEHRVELPLQQLARLPIEHVEDAPTDGFTPRHLGRTGLALPVPSLDGELLVDHIEADGKRIDDLGRKAALGVDLTGPERDFARQVFRELDRPKERREDVRDDADDLLRYGGPVPARHHRFEQAQPLALVHEGKPKLNASVLGLDSAVFGDPRLYQTHVPVTGLSISCRHERAKARAVGGPYPDATRVGRQTAPERASHASQYLVRPNPGGEVRGHIADDLDGRDAPSRRRPACVRPISGAWPCLQRRTGENRRQPVGRGDGRSYPARERAITHGMPERCGLGCSRQRR